MINSQDNRCKPVNPVWIERGILLTIMYHINKYYNELQTKIIIVDNDKHCFFLKKIYPSLKFQIFKKDDSSNPNYFYFNVRKINKKQDVIIDYLANYDDVIPSDKVNLVPWFDINDPLIVFRYSNKDTVLADKYRSFLNDFVKCRRSNYNGMLWDTYIEKDILTKYKENKKIINVDTSKILSVLNDFLATNYTNTNTVEDVNIPSKSSSINKMVKHISHPVIYYPQTQKSFNKPIDYELVFDVGQSLANKKDVSKVNDENLKLKEKIKELESNNQKLQINYEKIMKTETGITCEKNMKLEEENTKLKKENEKLKEENEKLKEENKKLKEENKQNEQNNNFLTQYLKEINKK